MKLQWMTGLAAVALLTACGAKAQGPPPPPEVNPEDTWQFHIDISSSAADVATNSGLTLGTDPEGKDGFDPMDLQGPIRPPSNFAALFILHTANEVDADGSDFVNHAGQYIKDIRSPIAGGQSKTFNKVILESNIAGAVSTPSLTLSWEDLSGVDPLIKLTFQDPDDVNGDGITSYDMRAVSSFTFTPTAENTDTTLDTNFTIVANNTSQPPPPVISNLSTTNLTSTGFGVSFSTDVATGATLEYGTSADALTNTATQSDAATSHTFTVTGLTPNTPYFYRVTTNQAGLPPTSSAVQTATTLQVLNNVGNITIIPAATSATVSFETSAAATATVEYGTSQDNLTQKIDVSTAQTKQTVVIPGLQTGTSYFFRVTSSAGGFQSLVSDVIPFTTLGDFTINIPVVTNIGATSASVTVGTGQAASVTVKYGTTDLSQTATGSSATSSTTVNLTGLQPGTTYQLQAVASATGFEDQTSPTVQFTTLKTLNITKAPDATNVGPNAATISLTTDVPVTANLEYGTTDFSQTASTTTASATPSFSLTNLQANTTYQYRLTLQAPGYESLVVASKTFVTTTGVTLGNGDVDGNGTVTVADAISAARIAIGALQPTADQAARADVRLPAGSVDVGDVVFILKLAVGLVTLP